MTLRWIIFITVWTIRSVYNCSDFIYEPSQLDQVEGRRGRQVKLEEVDKQMHAESAELEHTEPALRKLSQICQWRLY